MTSANVTVVPLLVSIGAALKLVEQVDRALADIGEGRAAGRVGFTVGKDAQRH